MANFPGLILTDAGRDILAKALTGQTLTFTRVALGDGTEPATPETLTALVNELQTISIQSFEVIGDGTSKIRAILTNVGITTGFFVREIGVFAQDPDTLQEVLYSYANSGSQSDFMPAEGGATIVEQVFDLFTVVDTATTVTAVIDDFITIATKSDIEEIRPYILPTGGLVGQLLRKASNAEGDTEWFNPSEGLDVLVASISETRTATAGQRTFNLSSTITNGLAVYVEGVRLRTDEWVALNATQVQLDVGLPAGTQVEFINNEEVGQFVVASVSLVGPALVFPGSSNTYTITDFDGFSTYVVTSDIGTVSRTNETITLDIGAAEPAGNLNLVVERNGAAVTFQVAIGAQSVAQPEILNPASGAIDVGSGVTVTTSAFLTYPNGADTHASTDWQIATDTGFTAIVFESLADATNLEAIDVPSGTFNTSTVYYIRARHNGTTLGASPYSATVSFTTAAQFDIVPLLAVAQDASPRITVYNQEIDTFTKLANPSALPAGEGKGVAFSGDDTYMAVAVGSSPYIAIYKRSLDTFTKLADPAILPTGQALGIAFSSDTNYVAVAHQTAPWVTVYKRSGDTFTKLADPSAIPPDIGRAVAFSSDATYLAVGHAASPFITIYKRSGDTFTKLANPASLPPGDGYGVAFSSDTAYMAVAHITSPFVTIYKRSGDTFTKLANPASLATGGATSVAFSSDTTYMAIGHFTSPFITIYKRSGDTFTKLANPATFPTGYALGVSFSSDTTYLAVGHDTSPFITIYKRSGDVFTKLANPATLPAGSSNSVDFSNTGFPQ